MTARTDIRQEFAAGAEIFHEGEPGDCAYVIERGAVEISTLRDGQKVVLARREAGEIFGEMAIIDRQSRSATVTALEPCRLLIVSAEQLQARIETLDPVLRMLLNVILGRFRESVRQVRGEATEPLIAAAKSNPIAVNSSAFDNLELEQTVRGALEAGDFRLHLQPIVATETRRIVGFESLARWEHAEFGTLSPGFFLPAIEKSGLTRPFTRWAVREAARLARRLNRDARNDGPLFLSVNVTGLDLDDPAFVDEVRAALDEASIVPDWLELEITESTLATDPERAIDSLGRLRALGVSTSIDDYGTGYSNLVYLSRFPVCKLKIDRSFVSKVAESQADRTIVESAAGLARSLGLSIVAEGVETEEQRDVLHAIGCDYLQGYLFGAPAPFEAALELVAAQSCAAVA